MLQSTGSQRVGEDLGNVLGRAGAGTPYCGAAVLAPNTPLLILLLLP